jgi:lipopolysaccharide assembly outer membrane protein LptD (OstA)
MPRPRLAILLLALLAPGAKAQEVDLLRERLADAPFTITADEISYDQVRDVYAASGQVTVEQEGGRRLRADWVGFSGSTRVGVATGNVRIEERQDVLSAEFAAIDLDTLEAIATDASLVAGETGFVITGSSLRKTGERTYGIEEATFSTCRCPAGSRRKPWELRTRCADIEVEGYARARDVSFRILGLPLLYTPWLILPAKTQRQTGFLIPSFSATGRNGAEIETPFFWAAREDLNLLLRPTWFAERGLKGALEFEHVFGAEGLAEGGGAFLPNDRDVEETDPETRFSDNRWAFWGRYEHPLGPGLRLGAEVARTSDNQYVLDFEDLPRALRSARSLESRAWASAAGRGLFASAEAAWLDDLQSPNDLDRDDFMLQRLPDVWLAALPRALGPVPLRLGMEVHYTYFHQPGERDDIGGIRPVRGQFFDTGSDGLFDFKEPDAGGTFTGGDNHLDNGVFEGDGLFQEGELLADHGHRVELYPRLSLPMRLGFLEALGEVGFRQSLYFTQNADSESRGLATARLDVRGRFARDFRTRSFALRHVVEPQVRFAFLSRRDQEDNPLLVPQGALRPERLIDADPRVLLRDSSDRLEDERFLSFGLQNRLFAPRRAGEPLRQIASLRLGSGYDFELDRLTNVFLAGELQLERVGNLELGFGWDPKEHEVDEALLSLGWSAEVGHEFSLSYRFLRDLPPVFEDFEFSEDIFDEFDRSFDRINQLGLNATWQVSRRLELFGSAYFSFEESATKSGEIGVVLHSACDCWDLVSSVRQRTRPSDTRFQIELRLAGFGGRER